MLRFWLSVICESVFISILITVTNGFDVYEQLQCEGNTWVSQCPSYSGHVFLRGFLGRKDPRPCRPNSQGDVDSCQVKGFLRRLQSACFAQEVCRFPVSSISGSCPRSASAYMKATYACVPVKLMWTLCTTPAIIREQEGFLVATALSLPTEDNSPCVVRVQAYRNQMVLIDMLQSYDNIQVTHCMHSLQIGKPDRRHADRSCHAASTRARFSWYVDVVIFHQMADGTALANSKIPPDRDFVKILMYFKVVEAKYGYQSNSDKTNSYPRPNRRPADTIKTPLTPSQPTVNKNTTSIQNPINTDPSDSLARPNLPKYQGNPASIFSSSTIATNNVMSGVFPPKSTPRSSPSLDTQPHHPHNPQDNTGPSPSDTTTSSHSTTNAMVFPPTIPSVSTTVTTPKTTTKKMQNKDYNQNLSINRPPLTTKRTTTSTTTTSKPTTTTKTSTSTTSRTTTTTRPTTTTITTTPVTTTTTTTATTQTTKYIWPFIPTTTTLKTTTSTAQTLPVSVYQPPQFLHPMYEKEVEAVTNAGTPSGVLWANDNSRNDKDGGTVYIHKRPPLTTPQMLQSNRDVSSHRYMILGVIAGTMVLAIFIVLVILMIVWKQRGKGESPGSTLCFRSFVSKVTNKRRTGRFSLDIYNNRLRCSPEGSTLKLPSRASFMNPPEADVPTFPPDNYANNDDYLDPVYSYGATTFGQAEPETVYDSVDLSLVTVPQVSASAKVASNKMEPVASLANILKNAPKARDIKLKSTSHPAITSSELDCEDIYDDVLVLASQHPRYKVDMYL